MQIYTFHLYNILENLIFNVKDLSFVHGCVL